MSKKLIIKGIGVSQGQAWGKVQIINKTSDLHRFHKGDILVTKITDPTMVSAMAKSSAIICDIGGITSHPSIVSRELGIPCIVNTKKATTVLKNGMLIIIDGKTGEVFSL